MEKLKVNWRWVFWICVIILLVWLYLKDIGVINTPLIIEAVPYLTGFGALFAFAREAGKYAHKIDRAVGDLREMKTELKEVNVKVTDVDKRVAVMEARGA